MVAIGCGPFVVGVMPGIKEFFFCDTDLTEATDWSLDLVEDGTVMLGFGIYDLILLFLKKIGWSWS